MSTGNVPIIIAAYSFIGFFTFITPILLHFITKKYITHLTYNEKTETYTATTVNFFCISRKVRKLLICSLMIVLLYKVKNSLLLIKNQMERSTINSDRHNILDLAKFIKV